MAEDMVHKVSCTVRWSFRVLILGAVAACLPSMPPLKLPVASDVMEIRVSVPRPPARIPQEGQARRHDDDDVRIISDRHRITAIMTKLAQLNHSWHQAAATFPTPQGSVSFRSTKDNRVGLWLGPNWLGGWDDLSTPKHDSNRLRTLPPDDHTELLQLLGLKHREPAIPGHAFEFVKP
jgi:hypothetical protein